MRLELDQKVGVLFDRLRRVHEEELLGRWARDELILLSEMANIAIAATRRGEHSPARCCHWGACYRLTRRRCPRLRPRPCTNEELVEWEHELQSTHKQLRATYGDEWEAVDETVAGVTVILLTLETHRPGEVRDLRVSTCYILKPCDPV